VQDAEAGQGEELHAPGSIPMPGNTDDHPAGASILQSIEGVRGRRTDLLQKAKHHVQVLQHRACLL